MTDLKEDVSDWCDKYGACKICGGEIPYGHLLNCFIYEQDQEIVKLISKLEALIEYWEEVEEPYHRVIDDFTIALQQLIDEAKNDT